SSGPGDIEIKSAPSKPQAALTLPCPRMTVAVVGQNQMPRRNQANYPGIYAGAVTAAAGVGKNLRWVFTCVDVLSLGRLARHGLLWHPSHAGAQPVLHTKPTRPSRWSSCNCR